MSISTVKRYLVWCTTTGNIEATVQGQITTTSFQLMTNVIIKYYLWQLFCAQMSMYYNTSASDRNYIVGHE